MIRRGGCTRKNGRWRDEESARAALTRIAADPKTTVIPTNTYECATCHFWHITSLPTTGGPPSRSAEEWGKVGSRKPRGRRRR